MKNLYGACALACACLAWSCGSSSPEKETTPHHAAGHSDESAIAAEPSATPAEPGAALADDPVAAEQAAFAKAQPIFEKYCGKCHGASGKESARKHFQMDTVPYGGPHAAEFGTLIPKVLGVGGTATMPKGRPGVVEGTELETLIAWAKAYQSAHESGAGHHQHHQH